MEIRSIYRTYFMKGSHSAFSDITSFQGNYYLGFMSGKKHMVDPENKSVILKSEDGVQWTPALQLHMGIDTREPKFMVLDGKLFAYFFTITPHETEDRMVTNSWYTYTEDGITWKDPCQFAQEEKFWRPVAFQGSAYCVTHPKDPAPNRYCRLMKSKDGIHWDFIQNIPIDPMEKPNEASITFDEQGRLLVFIRTDRGRCSAYILRAEAPYTHFEVFDLNQRMGGPLIWTHNGIIYISCRFYTETGTPHTGIFQLKEDMKPILDIVLPSYGDSSYAGIVNKLDGDGVWISYYSSHDCLVSDSKYSKANASIYLADAIY
ncbi:MAG: sialidase family protein [Candidatus Merdivicinus sp.]|jgi:hypothetical protein